MLLGLGQKEKSDLIQYLLSLTLARSTKRIGIRTRNEIKFVISSPTSQV
jgi:hypothetical protein